MLCSNCWKIGKSEKMLENVQKWGSQTFWLSVRFSWNRNLCSVKILRNFRSYYFLNLLLFEILSFKNDQFCWGKSLFNWNQYCTCRENWTRKQTCSFVYYCGSWFVHWPFTFLSRFLLHLFRVPRLNINFKAFVNLQKLSLLSSGSLQIPNLLLSKFGQICL